MIPKQSQCLQLFGNPSNPKWAAEHLVYVDVPWVMFMGDLRITHVKVNKVAADSLKQIFTEIWAECGKDQKRIKKEGLDVFSGDWVIRQARGLRIKSMHSFGLALDFNAPENELGNPEEKTLFKSDSLVVKIFEKRGWVWGGRWHWRRDAMHFQYAIVD